eukprot:TRINITY_DN33660_c0_g1_i1.p1 TRINITY_DN33660_c0_g1~~TRINITY_DN33660_c0_g1_i1.p1  ORF type:complete len:523 (-),score=71.31 TRINITY_DN33660_c0_g1_i1:194-1762(-)
MATMRVRRSQGETPRTGRVAVRRVTAPCSRPKTLRDLRARIPNVDEGTKVLLADIGGERRAIATDQDVQELFGGRCPNSTVDVELRELFPPREGTERGSGGACRPSSASCVVSVPVSGPFRGDPSFSPPIGGWPRVLEGRPRNSQTPRPPPKPRWSFSTSTSRRPSSACVSSGLVEPSPPASPCKSLLPNDPSYDGRPGRRLDIEWAGHSAVAHQTGTVSAELLQSFGMREEYERLRFESRRQRELLEKLLKTRDSIPGIHTDFETPSLTSGGSLTGASVGIGLKAAVGPRDWQKGEYCLVAGHDVPKLREAIESLAQIETLACMRLQDEGNAVCWCLANASKLVAEERRLAAGRPTLLPRRVLLESPWLQFGDIGDIGWQVAFRLLPRGDGASAQDDATIFVWMAAPPPISFSFCVRVASSTASARAGGRGGSCAKATEPNDSGVVCTAPRLWRADAAHYRVDVSWTELQGVLMDMASRDERDMELSLLVLQWHGSSLEGDAERYSGSADTGEGLSEACKV